LVKSLGDTGAPLATPSFTNDSGSDWTAAGLATGAGGKLKYRIDMGVCMPVNETIEFKSFWNEKLVQ
jgi:hypothetical protein